MSAGPGMGNEIGHPLQPNAVLVPAHPVPGLGAVPPPARSVVAPAQLGRQGDYRVYTSLTHKSHLAKHQ